MPAQPTFNIGIEEEYQIVDPETRELRSYITELLEEGKLILREQVKPELHQSIVEIGTHVCQTPAEVREEIVRLRRGIMELAARSDLKIAAVALQRSRAGTQRRRHAQVGARDRAQEGERDECGARKDEHLEPHRRPDERDNGRNDRADRDGAEKEQARREDLAHRKQ